MGSSARRTTLRLDLPVPVTDEGLRRLCAELRRRLSTEAVDGVVCRVDRAAADLATVDAVARLALVARRAGVAFAVDAPDGELPELLGLVGLRAVLTEP